MNNDARKESHFWGNFESFVDQKKPEKLVAHQIKSAENFQISSYLSP